MTDILHLLPGKNLSIAFEDRFGCRFLYSTFGMQGTITIIYRDLDGLHFLDRIYELISSFYKDLPKERFITIPSEPEPPAISFGLEVVDFGTGLVTYVLKLHDAYFYELCRNLTPKSTDNFSLPSVTLSGFFIGQDYLPSVIQGIEEFRDQYYC